MSTDFLRWLRWAQCRPLLQLCISANTCPSDCIVLPHTLTPRHIHKRLHVHAFLCAARATASTVYGRMEASRHAVHDVSSRHVSAPRQGWSVLALPKAAHSRTLALMRTHTHTYTHAHACTLIRTHTHTQPGAAILRWNTVCHDTSLPNSLR